MNIMYTLADTIRNYALGEDAIFFGCTVSLVTNLRLR